MSTAVIIPAYNAARALPAVLARIPPGLDGVCVYIVNDGSTDDTARVARQALPAGARAWQHLEVIDLPRNRGYGGAMKAGLSAALARGPEAAACIHADGQYAPEELPAMLGELRGRGLDLLQGSRLASGAALSGGMPLYKYLAGRGLCALENRVLGLALSDYHSGYLVYSGRALGRLPFSGLSDSFDFDLEVIAAARALGLAVGERPIPTRYAGETSHLNPVTYGLRVLRAMARYRAGHYHRLVSAHPGAWGHEA